MPGTRFFDVYSGGDIKIPDKEIILIEAPIAQATEEFIRRFGRDPRQWSCLCCGPDYDIGPFEGEIDTEAKRLRDEWDESPHVVRAAELEE